MPSNLVITPHGQFLLEESADPDSSPLSPAISARLQRAFSISSAAGLLHLATAELQTHLPPDLDFARDLARQYLTHLCRAPSANGDAIPPIPPPPNEELSFFVMLPP